MQRLLLYVFFLFFVASCQQKRVTNMPVQQSDPESVIIDYPAIVVLDSAKESDLQKIIASQNNTISLKLLDTVSNAFVFVKANGDRVSVEWNKLHSKYDLIFFTPDNDPIPCRINDLSKVLKSRFDRSENQILVVSPTSKVAKFIANDLFPGDTNTAIKKNRWFGKNMGTRQPKKLILVENDFNRNLLLPRTKIPVEFIIHSVDKRRFLKFSFENDLITFANTDRYFTNGIAIEYQSSGLSGLPFAYVMFPYKKAADAIYSMGLYQDMFTPTDTRVEPTLKHDRPYASYLFIGYKKQMTSVENKVSLTSGLDLGYLGPYSPGFYLQTLVHETFPTNDLPKGWETQIKTDLIANYNLTIEKALVLKKHFLFSGILAANAGTLNTSADAGIRMVCGNFESVFDPATFAKSPNIKFNVFFKSNLKAVGWNSLLQGGVFNKNNIFTLRGDEVCRLVADAQIGMQFKYKKVGVEMAQHFISPEYKGGMWHKWGRLSLQFQLK